MLRTYRFRFIAEEVGTPAYVAMIRPLPPTTVPWSNACAEMVKCNLQPTFASSNGCLAVAPAPHGTVLVTVFDQSGYSPTSVIDLNRFRSAHRHQRTAERTGTNAWQQFRDMPELHCARSQGDESTRVKKAFFAEGEPVQARVSPEGQRL